MNEDQFFNELKTSLGQAIDYAEDKTIKSRTKTVDIKELTTFSAQENQKSPSTDKLNAKINGGPSGRFHQDD